MQRTHPTSRLKVATLLGSLALASTALLGPTAEAAPVAPVAPAASALALEVEAQWEMSEPAGATTMIDSGPHRLNASIDQDGLDTGVVFDGATGYAWPYRSPTAAPASPERVIQIPDSSNLDPRNDRFTVEIRYRTRERFGNITQKGQATTPGGQFKIQNPQGRPSCLFKGSVQRGAVRAPSPLNDNRWHVLRCVKLPTAVEMYVDGQRVGRKNGSVGWIDNNWPWTIGGKHRCDQIKVTCDYFTGHIDYVRVTRG